MSVKIRWVINTIRMLFLTAPISVFATGVFHFTVIHDGDKEHEQYARYIEEKGTFKKIINALNTTLNIPYDIYVVMTNRTGGAVYFRTKKIIMLDYGDVSLMAKEYDKANPSADKVARQYFLNNINLGGFYHELGHALIDAYQIPVVGKEEDAADSLSAVMILYYFNKGEQILLDNTFFWKAFRNLDSNDDSRYWDVHSLNDQRYYRLLCYAYAKSPEYVTEKLKEEDDEDHTLNQFISSKKTYCLKEYKKLNKAWFNLLKPHFKNSEEAEQAIQKINGSIDKSQIND
jgi:hypothetical protein